ncbi:MAG TPA: DNA repair protein RecO [Candidatus Saccharimonadales bacterium]|nr:DNA repair protein RecO [Candidatus Saccharimonadales bacterium]
MNQLVTQGIILSRTDFGEADRIITLLTPDHGKLRLMARGVRKVKSKLAGGIELFSVSHITFIRGRGDMGTLVSTRLVRHYGHIVGDIERVQLGYDLIKTLNRATEDEPEADYFHLLQGTFEALDDTAIATGLISLWFGAQLLRLAGHSPNLRTDSAGQPLSPGGSYDFNFDDMAFVSRPDGHFGADHIKFLRLVFGGNPPQVLQKIQNIDELVQVGAPLVQTMLRSHVRV